MRRGLPLALAIAIALLATPAAAQAAGATPRTASVFVLHARAAGKADLVRLAGSGPSLSATAVWSGALPAAAKLAVGSFDGTSANEALALSPWGKTGARLLLFTEQPPAPLLRGSRVGLPSGFAGGTEVGNGPPRYARYEPISSR